MDTAYQVLSILLKLRVQRSLGTSHDTTIQHTLSPNMTDINSSVIFILHHGGLWTDEHVSKSNNGIYVNRMLSSYEAKDSRLSGFSTGLWVA